MGVGFDQSVHRSEPVFSIDSKVADKKCQLCWRPKQMEAGAQESSSESSSSTESETDEGEEEELEDMSRVKS